MLYTIVNGLLFNLTWLVIVSTESAVIAPAAAILHLLLHFALIGSGYRKVKVIAHRSP